MNNCTVAYGLILIEKRQIIVIEKKEREGKLFLDVVRFEKSTISINEIIEHFLNNEDDIPF